MILNDRQIAHLAIWCGMITPFEPEQRCGVFASAKELNAGGPITRAISFGLSSFGYDIRIGRRFKVFSNAWGSVIDPKAFDPQAFVEREVEDFIIIPPNSFALGESVEEFHMPQNVIGLCTGKSTYARCAVSLPMTPLEPGWKGKLTIEISNTAPLPVKVYAMEGIAQILFFQGERPSVTYSDRSGKYQHQGGVTLPVV